MCPHNNDGGIGSTALYGWRGEVYKVKGGGGTVEGGGEGEQGEGGKDRGGEERRGRREVGGKGGVVRVGGG